MGKGCPLRETLGDEDYLVMAGEDKTKWRGELSFKWGLNTSYWLWTIRRKIKLGELLIKLLAIQI